MNFSFEVRMVMVYEGRVCSACGADLEDPRAVDLCRACSDALLHESLSQYLARVEEELRQVCILTGPFSEGN